LSPYETMALRVLHDARAADRRWNCGMNLATS
jgi:hypothetical protein